MTRCPHASGRPTPGEVGGLTALSGIISEMDAQRAAWKFWSSWLAAVCALVLPVLCIFGLLMASGGLDVEESCTIEPGGSFNQDGFDREYWAANHQTSLLPPYSTACNAGHDLVPWWVNPAIALIAAAFVLSLVYRVVLGIVAHRKAKAHSSRLP